MRAMKRLSGLLLAFCMIASMTVPVLAAQKESYTYQIRFLSGAQGEFNRSGNLTNNGTQSPKYESGECLVFENLQPGQRVSFSNGMITLKDSGKYYVKGIRESGKDNNTVYYSAFIVEGDKDYVVAYGILGDAVAYTINYEDENGNQLAPSETYYGNVGDRPVVSYLYIEGYEPQAYNLIGRLSENAADNVFTFVYRRATGGTTTTTTTVTPGETTVTTTTIDDGTVVVPGGTDDAAAGGAGAGGAAAGGAGGAAGGAGGAAGGAGDGGAVAAPDGDVPLGPADIQSVDDEEVPLGNGSNILGDGSKAPTDFAKLLAVPTSAKVGIVSALALIAGSVVRFFGFGKRKKEKDE